MFYAAPISKHWQLAPEGSGVVQGEDDIDQCIRNILSTRKGADVTRPDFGSDHYKWLDTPEDVFVPQYRARNRAGHTDLGEAGSG